MHVLKFPTLAKAKERSHAEAAKRIEGHTTELWWGAVKCDGEYWLLVNEDTPEAIEVPDNHPIESVSESEWA